MITISGRIAKYPARASALWYLGLILLGGFVLWLPPSQQYDDVPFIDCLFTATSATCVTGLYSTPRQITGEDFTWFGQAVIVLLIQIGGVGIMTITTLITFQLRGRTRLRERAVLAETMGAGNETDLRWVVRHVFLATIAFEGAGFLVLAANNLVDGKPFFAALWQGLFHAVSAFCNAGFALPKDNLTPYQGNIAVNLTIMSLIVCGGIGFPVMLDLRRQRRRDWRGLWERLHMHSKLMFLGTAILLTLGTVILLLFEWDEQVMDGMPWWKKVMVCAFHSVSCRTAGFNTVPIGTLTNASLFVMVLLMMIGAGPCSTAGGFKVSTLMTLVCRSWASFRGQRVVNVFRRTIPPVAIERAGVTALLYTIVGGLGLTLLLGIEQAHRGEGEYRGPFLEALFEVYSALGTVGLSMGLTPRLSGLGKTVIMLLMFVGRLGPITAFVALARTGRDRPIEYPQEEPLIG
jgi:trk system potassium uptake protein TrkH